MAALERKCINGSSAKERVDHAHARFATPYGPNSTMRRRADEEIDVSKGWFRHKRLENAHAEFARLRGSAPDTMRSSRTTKRSSKVATTPSGLFAIRFKAVAALTASS